MIFQKISTWLRHAAPGYGVHSKTLRAEGGGAGFPCAVATICVGGKIL